MIYIYDFEDGLQNIFAYILGTPTTVRYWDRKGFFSEIDISDSENKNIIITSKPYDCLQRGVIKGKYDNSDEKKLKDWSRRNWRYSNPEIYEHVNSIIDRMESYLIVHPDDIVNGNLKTKIKDYLGINLNISDSKLKEIYNENVNIK